MVTLLYNALNRTGKLTKIENSVTIQFTDAKDISSWAIEAIDYFAESAIISGSGNKLLPKSKATRAELAQTLYNILK